MVKTKVTGKPDKFVNQESKESNQSQSEEEEYEVQDILKKKIIKGGDVQYLVKWKGNIVMYDLKDILYNIVHGNQLKIL